jgi:glutaminyl-peptide cyclotransferase
MKSSTRLFTIGIIAFVACLAFVYACNGDDKPTIVDPPTIVSNGIPAPANIGFESINMYPHDTTSYTQGLEFYGGKLYESTGLEGESKLRIVDLKTGKPAKSIDIVDTTVFGEGITILHDTIYQITWKSQKCYVYDAKNWQVIKTFAYNTEGWGLTNDGKYIIMSDGTDKIYYRDPSTFNVAKIVSVKTNEGPLGNLNELEMINGFLYANVYGYDFIAKINVESGNVVGKIDMARILEKAGYQNTKLESDGSVLNGIAFDSVNNKIYVTGKLWPALFEVKFPH